MASLLSPIAALAANAIVQILVFRSYRGAHYFRSIVQGFIAGFVTLAVIEFGLAFHCGAIKDRLVFALLVNIPIYFALSYCAYNFIQLGQTSIRLRMYSEIASRPAGVSIEEMKREYDDHRLMQVRLLRLVESGDIIEKNGCYFVGRRRFVIVSDILFTAKRILLGKASEFE